MLFALTLSKPPILALFVLAVLGAQHEGLNFPPEAMSSVLLDIHADLKHAWHIWAYL